MAGNLTLRALGGEQVIGDCRHFLKCVSHISGASIEQALPGAGLNMRGGDEADDRHAGGNAGVNATNTVFDDDCPGRRDRELPGGMEKDIRVGFAARHRRYAVDMRLEKRAQSDDVQANAEPFG